MRTTRLIFTKRFGKNNRSGTKWHHPLAYFSRFFSSSAAAAAATDDSFVSTKCSPCLVHSSLSNGLLDYARGWAWQQTVLRQRLELRRQSPNNNNHNDDADCVFLFHHHPVYTLGRGADESHLVFFQGECCLEEEKKRLARSNRGVGSARLSVDARHHQVEINNNPRRMQSKPSSLREAVTLLSELAVRPVMAPNGVPIYRVERGGEVTFHGPGQLVVYPLFDLRRVPFQQDLHWYLRMMEEVVIRTCLEYDIDACRDEHHTGVWVRMDNNSYKKVAAVGVTASKWITTHGFALNVHPDLSYFDTANILPCGIEGRGVTSIEEICVQRGGATSEIPTVDHVASVVLQNLQDVFGIELEHGESLK